MIFGMRAYTAREIGTIPVPTQSQPRYQEARNLFSPFFLLLPALVAPGCSADRSQQVLFSTKARSYKLLRSLLPAGSLQ